MDDKRSYAVAVVVAAVLLLLPCLYVASYFALVRTDSDPLAFNYRFGGTMAERLYRPINWIDRRLCPNHPRWRTEIQVDYIETGYEPDLEEFFQRIEESR